MLSLKEMHNQNPIAIVKASGAEEFFSEEKIIKSLAKSGLSKDTTTQTLDYLKNHLQQGMTTNSIYDHVSSYLQKNAPLENYFNYGLKRAIMALGPSGFAFEILISELLKKNNYKTEIGVITQGKCVTHEIDVIAQKGKEKYFIECKFHNTLGYKTDIQVALYSYARFLDVDMAQKTNGNVNNFPWLITNTKVTSEVITYCHCVNLKVTTMTQPAGQSLQDLIISSRLHPITLLYDIPREKIDVLLKRGIVTCSKLKNAILNQEINDLFNRNETSQLLTNIVKLCKENE